MVGAGTVVGRNNVAWLRRYGRGLAPIDCLDVRRRVDRSSAAGVNLEVEVRDRGIAGHPDLTDDLAGLHRGADRQSGGERTHVGVEEVGAVGGRQSPPVTAERARRVEVFLGEGPVFHGVEPLSGLGDDVDAFVDSPAGPWGPVGVSERAWALGREHVEPTLPGAAVSAGGAARWCVVVTAGVAPPGKHSVWPGWITVAVVALLAFNRAVIVTLAFDEIRLHESPLITVYVAPGHAGPDGATALAMAATGTMPMAKTTIAKSQRLRVDARRAPPAEFVAY